MRVTGGGGGGNELEIWGQFRFWLWGTHFDREH